MPDVTLSDGREIAFNLNAMTLAEYRQLLDPEQERAEEDAILSRVAGLTVDEYTALGYLDWVMLTRAVFQKLRNPLADPNSASASTDT